MPTTQWIRSGDTQFRKTVFARAYSDAKTKGATAEFFEGGTTTPWTVFYDSGESSPIGNKVEVDADARWPDVFVPTGQPFDFIIRDFDGEVISQSVNVPNADPAPEAAPTPATFVTGMTVFMETDAELSLWVRQNGGSIGSLASGATERANLDTQALYEFVWDNSTQDTNPVAGGVRGASGFADFQADLAIALVDKRGAVSIGLDGMGQPAGGFFTDVAFTTGDATQPGSLAGVNSAAITIEQLPAHTHPFGTLATVDESEHTHGVGTYSASSSGSEHQHSGTTGNNNADHTHQFTAVASSSGQLVQAGTGTNVMGFTAATVQATAASGTSHQHSFTTSNDGAHVHPLIGVSATGLAHNHDISGATASIGGDEFHSSVSRAILGTWFQKL